MQNLINQNKYDFIGPVALTFILLVGISIGFLNGIKSSSFFFVLNIFSFVGSILIFHFKDHIMKLFPQNYAIGKTPIKDLISIKEIKIALVALIVITFYLFMNIFIFIPIYFFFRKKLKFEIFKNKKLGKSNIKYRLFGSIFGFFTLVPFAIIIGNIGSSLGTNNDFYSFINQMNNFIFFGISKNINNGIQEFLKIS